MIHIQGFCIFSWYLDPNDTVILLFRAPFVGISGSTNHRVTTSVIIKGSFVFKKNILFDICKRFHVQFINFFIANKLTCPWLSQNLQWVLSKGYSAIMGIWPRIRTTFQRTVTSLAIMTCCQSETVHPPPRERTEAAAAAAMNDTKGPSVATGTLSRTAVRFFSILTLPPYVNVNLLGRQLLGVTQKAQSWGWRTVGPWVRVTGQEIPCDFPFLLVLELHPWSMTSCKILAMSMSLQNSFSDVGCSGHRYDCLKN